MSLEEEWNGLNEQEKDALADAWLTELRGEDKSNLGQAEATVMTMTFTALPETQWDFLLRSIRKAKTSEELLQIGVGPLESLLGRYGDRLIDSIEHEARTNPRLTRAITSVWKHGMSDATWRRVQALKGTGDDPAD